MAKKQEYKGDLDIDETNSMITVELPSVIPDFIQKIKELLFNPDSFFQNLNNSPLSLKIPFLIIFLLCLTQINYLNYPEIFSKFAGDSVIKQAIIIIDMGVSFISGFYQWIIISLIFTILIYFYTHTFFSPFIRTLSWVAYGMVPNFFLIIVNDLFDLVFSPVKNAIYEDILSKNDFSVSESEWDLIFNSYKMNPIIFGLTLVEVIIGIIFLLWSAKIWYYGLGHAESLSENQTRTIIQIIIGIFIGLKILFWIY